MKIIGLDRIKKAIAGPAERIKFYLGRITFPGFKGLPVYDVGDFFIKAIQSGAIQTRASAVSFNFFLALFPGMLFLFSLMAFIPIDNFKEELLSGLQNFMPDMAFELSRTTIEDMINNQRSGLVSFGLILALFFATAGISSLHNAFGHSIYIRKHRNYLRNKMISAFMTILLMVLLFSSVTLVLFGKAFLAYLNSEGIIGQNTLSWMLGIKWILVLFLLYFSIAMIFYFAPGPKRKWRVFSPGTTLATMLLLLFTVGFGYYVNHFGQYNKLYGSIGALIVIMVWINLTSLALIVGFELNASIIARSFQNKNQKS